jgi:CBS domain-containing membrane protein
MSIKFLLSEIRSYLGIERNTTSHREKIISGAGAALGVFAVYLGALWAFPEGLNTAGNFLLITSMGASAVLLFAVPQGALSQPWHVVGGHVMSAAVGVTCQLLFPSFAWTGALAVGLAVSVMYYLRCIHPPGGATALLAVIGGPEVYNLGYAYVVTPVAVNVISILLMAIVFNAFFPWRRYPAHLSRRHRLSAQTKPAQRQYELTREDFAAAMQALNSYVDITADSLTELLELAKQHAEKNITHPEEIHTGHFYSNGKLGNLWSVRQVTAIRPDNGTENDTVVFNTVAGARTYDSGESARGEFKQWARFEVKLQNGHWVRVGEFV